MTLDRRQLLTAFALSGAASLVGCSSASSGGPTAEPQGTNPDTTKTPTPSSSDPVTPKVRSTIATGINVPWGLAFLASQDALVSERDRARVLKVTADGNKTEIGTIAGVDTDAGEGGLLGIALTPDESELYAYYTSADDNRVVRMSFDGTRLGNASTVLTAIPRSTFHNGGRIAFGPDGQLYVTTGDAGETGNAMDRKSLAGKILRLTPAGRPAPGNPFDNAAWSIGHRNIQGIAWDKADRLWATEFGNKRIDELNQIVAGKNYGWPEVEGRGDNDTYVNPKATWPTDVCSPSGLAIARSTAFVAGLRGESLYSVALDGTTAATPERLFEGKYGRIRTVAVAPDGALWMTTSNTDGRADPGRDDDRILRVTI